MKKKVRREDERQIEKQENHTQEKAKLAKLNYTRI